MKRVFVFVRPYKLNIFFIRMSALSILELNTKHDFSVLSCFIYWEMWLLVYAIFEF